MQAQVPPQPHDVCTKPGAACVIYADIWGFQPGIPQGSIAPCECGDLVDESKRGVPLQLAATHRAAAVAGPPAGCNWALRAPATGTQPPARFFHAAAAIADDMYIYGGTNAAGAVRLFAY